MEKGNIKKFIKETKNELICGAIIGTLSGAIFGVKIIKNYNKKFNEGFIQGLAIGAGNGFVSAIDWCNEKFPETDLKNLWENYKKLNPDEIIHFKG